MGAVNDSALALASAATAAVGSTRALLLSSMGNSLEEQLAQESRAIASSRTHSAREGIAAFLAKRRPDFTG